MVTAAHRIPPDPGDVDQFVYLRNVSWKEYEAVLAMRGESATPRITYLKGVLELMSPSRHREMDKKRLARLLEAWAEAKGIALEGIGSWTLKNSREERGAEPDECYTVDRVPESDDDRPDIAIEVVWTSGGIDKLEVYRKLGVREVWFYERGTLRFFAFRGETYVSIPVSAVLPTIDVSLLLACMEQPTQLDAIRTLRAALG
ncbi:MAG TPA: Uma2 family endonuclease [Polyangiaceae bacterium]